MTWHRLKEWLTWTEWRYQLVYRLGGMVHRAQHGWAPKDTWSFDTHLSRVIAGGLRHLAKHTHGCPMDFVTQHGEKRCHKEWKKWLNHTAYWFDRYANDFGTDHYPYQGTDREKNTFLDKQDLERKYFETVIMRDFVKYYGDLWD